MVLCVTCPSSSTVTVSTPFSTTLTRKHTNEEWGHQNEDPPWSYFDGLVQERCNSSALAMELHLSCRNPSIFSHEMTLIRKRCPFQYKEGVSPIQEFPLYNKEKKTVLRPCYLYNGNSYTGKMVSSIEMAPRVHFNIKMPSYMYKDSC